MFCIAWLVLVRILDVARGTQPDDRSCLLQTTVALSSHRQLNESKQAQLAAQVLDSLEAPKGDKTEPGWVLGASEKEINNNSYEPELILLGVSEFQTSYKWEREASSKAKSNGTLQIKGVHPRQHGQFPVYLHLTGSFCEFGTQEDMDFVRYMGARGYVAAAVQYDNGRYCPDLCEDSGKCAYEYPKYKHHRLKDTEHFGSMSLFEKARRVQNALDVLCGMTSSDCSQGVAVSGYSQGAFLANVWALWDNRISALLSMGIGLLEDDEDIDHSPWHRLVVFNQSCLEDGRRLSNHVPRTRRRYIDGSRDKLIGVHHKALQKYSGYHCENSTYPIDCIQPDGSGYYIVSATQYEEADVELELSMPLQKINDKVRVHKLGGHNFFGDTRPIINKGKLLPSFKNGDEPWCMHPSLDWLAATARQNKVSATESHNGAPKAATALATITAITIGAFHSSM